MKGKGDGFERRGGEYIFVFQQKRGGGYLVHINSANGLLSLMKFTYCRMVSALILPMIPANKPFVIFA